MKYLVIAMSLCSGCAVQSRGWRVRYVDRDSAVSKTWVCYRSAESEMTCADLRGFLDYLQSQQVAPEQVAPEQVRLDAE